MSQQDNFQIRFVKPIEDEPELESSNLTLVCPPISKDPDTETSIQQLSATSPDSGKSKLRLAVSEFSLKLAQRIEEKYSTPDKEKAPAKSNERFKKLAMDVSKNVKMWSIEQQKLAGIAADTPSKPEAESRSRASSVNSKPVDFISDKSELDESIEEAVEAIDVSPTVSQSISVHNIGSGKLKSFSCNENLSRICSKSDDLSSRPISLMPMVSEQQGSTGSLTADDEEITEKTSKENNPLLISSVLIGAAKSHILLLTQNKFFPAAMLAFCVAIFRWFGIPDMICGTVLGTLVTWYFFVYQHPTDKPFKHTTKLERKSLQLFSKQATFYKSASVALMHLVYSYDPCTFRLRHSYMCLVNLQGTILRISVLDRRSVKEIKAKFDIELQSPQNLHQLEGMTFSDTHVFDLSMCSVSLTPPVLARKRYFNKKYPILVSRHQNDASQRKGGPTQNFFLFTLGMREKEQWYTLLASAARGIVLKPFDLVPVRRISPENTKESQEADRRDSVRLSKLKNSISLGNMEGESIEFHEVIQETQSNSSPSKNAEDAYHWHYVSRRQHLRWFLSQAMVLAPSSSLAWFNAFAWRIFYEIMSVEDLKKQLEDKMQAKLHKLILPRIIEPLRLSEMTMGARLPMFKSCESPFIDDRGFWLTFNVEYDGGLGGTIETRVNLLKAKAVNLESGDLNQSISPVPSCNRLPRTPDSRYLDILARESCESCTSSSESDDESSESVSANPGASHNSGHIIERLTNSRYFAKLIAIERVGKAAERVSLIPLTLKIEVNKIYGRMKVNFPPPPSDRLWIGFEDDENFHMDLSLKPKVGNVELSGRTLQPIVSFLEKKIINEFRKRLVLPAMDDFFFLQDVYKDLENSTGIEG